MTGPLPDTDQILESITDAIFTLDTKWRFQYLNQNAAELLQSSPEALLGAVVWDAFPEAVGSIFEEKYRKALEQQETVHFEAPYDPLDIWVNVRAYPFDNGLTVIFQNVTERRQVKEEMERVVARNRAIVEALPDNVYLLSRNRVFIEAEVKQASCPSTGEIIGKQLKDVMPDDLAERFHRAIDAVLVSGHGRMFSYGFEDETGAHHDQEARIMPVEGNGVLLVVRDITERKALERELLRISEEERQRIGRDLHDGIGSLLSGISMISQGVISDLENDRPIDSEELETIATLAEEGVAHARALARGLSPVRLDAEGLVAALRELSHNVEIMTGVPVCLLNQSGLPVLPTEVATQLYWIAHEAVNNAARHARANRIAVSLVRDDEEIVLTVSDDGDGLADDGTEPDGMGLRIMRHRAHVIGGRIHIDSAPGDGTTVTCTIPTTEPTSTATVEHIHEASP